MPAVPAVRPTRSEMHQPRHRFLLGAGKPVFESGEPVEAGHVLTHDGAPLFGRKLFGQPNSLPSVIRPVGTVKGKMAGPQEMGTTQFVAILHRRPVLVDGEPEVAS